MAAPRRIGLLPIRRRLGRVRQGRRAVQPAARGRGSESSNSSRETVEKAWLVDSLQSSSLQSQDTPPRPDSPAPAPLLADRLGRLRYQYCELNSSPHLILQHSIPCCRERDHSAAWGPAVPSLQDSMQCVPQRAGPFPAVNWRQDTWSDMQLFVVINSAVFLAGAVVQVGAGGWRGANPAGRAVPRAAPDLVRSGPHPPPGWAPLPANNGLLSAAALVLTDAVCGRRALQALLLRGMDESAAPLPEGAGLLHQMWHSLYSVLAVVLG